MFASDLAFERFLGFFFFFFFCATVASSSTRDKAESSRGEAEAVELVRDGLVKGACSRSWKFSVEAFSMVMFAMRVRVIGELTAPGAEAVNAVTCSTPGRCSVSSTPSPPLPSTKSFLGIRPQALGLKARSN